MYSIGIFSKMNRVTTKTLRYYDAIDLLKPAHIDEQTGYRYYSSDQFARLSQIMALKQLGLSLTDIKNIIDDTKSLQIYLKIREKELKDLMVEVSEKLLSIENYNKRLQNNAHMIYTPVLRSLPEVIVASMKFHATSYDTYFEQIPKMGIEMEQLGAVCAEPPYCFILYHDGYYKDHHMNVEVCEAVTHHCNHSEKVVFKTLPSVPTALCILHKGPYEQLRHAYAFAYDWIKDNQYHIAGPPRESALDGIWNKTSSLDWLTELQIPITKDVMMKK